MIEKLKRVLRQKDTVLFIGSGVSMWSGLPSWPALIKELALFRESKGYDPSEVLGVLDSGKLQLAAGVGFQGLTEPEKEAFFRMACRVGEATPHDIHHKIITLGPTCFVTTNYDQLLEQSFQQWRPNSQLRIVLNKNLSGGADISRPHSTNFLFKLHGDVEVADSVILSADQYRTLRRFGELEHVSKTMEQLLVGRPFVYIGFGLNDQDYQQTWDESWNVYKEGAKDHFVIMPDVSEGVQQYYKEKFHLNIISYKTDNAGASRHAPLLTLLDELRSAPIAASRKASGMDGDSTLRMARYAASLARSGKTDVVIPLKAYPVEKDGYRTYRNREIAIEQLLDAEPGSFILIGAPGSGKSYSLRSSVARTAAQLEKHIGDNDLLQNSAVIPFIVDLKLYKGSIRDLLEEALPPEIDTDFVLKNYKLKIFLDAFNEMPREYIESDAWQKDFSNTLKEFTNATWIISSRTSHGLLQYGLPIFILDTIDIAFVEKSLQESHIHIKEEFEREAYATLQIPFFYKLVFKSHYKLDGKPNALYADLIGSIDEKFQQQFETKVSLVPALSIAAMEAIDAGQEAFGLEMLSRHLAAELSAGGVQVDICPDIVDWLIGLDILIPLPEQKISFFHQSVTEYLAASRLAKLFEADADVLKRKLRFMRWDQALLLTMDFLKEDKAEQFLQMIIDLDFDLAMSAVKYFEGEKKPSITKKLLEEVFSKAHWHFDAARIASSLQVNNDHIPVLRAILAKRGEAGGIAFSLLIDPLGLDLKQEGFELLMEEYGDQEFCMAAAEGLEKLIGGEDIPTLLKLSERIQQHLTDHAADEHDYRGFTLAIAYLICRLDPVEMYHAFFDPNKEVEPQEINLSILISYLLGLRTQTVLKLLLDLLLAGVDRGIHEINSFFQNSGQGVLTDYSLFTKEHLERFSEVMEDGPGGYAQACVQIMRNICSAREDLRPFFIDMEETSVGMNRLCYTYFLSQHNDYTKFFMVLEEIADMPEEELSDERLFNIAFMNDVSWKGHESFLMKVLWQGNRDLIVFICFSIGWGANSQLDLSSHIGSVYPWLERFSRWEDEEEDISLSDNVAKLITNNISLKKGREFLDEFNRKGTPYRPVLARYFLPKLRGYTTNDLNEEAISYLLDPANDPNLKHFRAILGNNATDEFAETRLLPLVRHAEGKFLEELKETLKQLGGNYRRRYL